MKKNLYTTHYFLTVILLLLCNHALNAQTVFTDDYNRTPFGTTGGTPTATYAIRTGTVNMVGSGSSYVATIPSATTAGETDLASLVSVFSSPFVSTLSSNQSILTWTLNMRTSNAVTNLPSATAISGAVDLISDGNANIFSGTGNGYAVMFNQGTNGGIELVRFTSGMAAAGCSVLIAPSTVMSKTNYYSVRVTYEPSSNTWSLYLRDDGGTGFADPSSGVTTLIGSTTNNTYTGTALTKFGYMYGYTAGTAGSKVMSFDNFSVAVGPTISFTGVSAPVCNTGDQTFSATVTNSPSAGGTMPRVYFKKNSGSWFSSPGTFVSGSLYNFTISASAMGGLSTGDVVSYYVIAQDVSNYSVVYSKPYTGLVATSVNSVSTPPTTPNTFTVTDVPSGVSATALPSPLCAGSTLTLTGNASNATSYSWSGPGSYSSTAQNPNTPAVSTGNYTFTATNSCGSTTTTAAVTVNPVPTGIAPTILPSPACSGQTTTLTGTVANATTYAWNGPGGFSSAAQNTTRLATAGVYSFTATNSCGSASTTVTVTVITPPTAVSATVSPTSICLGQTLTLRCSAGGAVSYLWNGPAGFSSTVQNTNTSAAAAGAFTLTAINSCGTASATTTAVAIVSAPTGVVASANPNPICSGATLTLSGTASGATTYLWSGPNSFTSTDLNPASFTAGVLSAGTYTLSASLGTCTTMATTAVIVNTATPGSISGTAALWPSTSSTLTVSGSGGAWSSSAPSIVSVNSSTGVITSFSTIGSATISYNNGCGSPATSLINVFSSTPITGSTSMCVITPNLIPAESWESGVPTSAGTPVDGWRYAGTSGYWAQQLASSSSGSSCNPAPGGSYVAQFNSNTLTAGSTASLISPAFSLVGCNGAYVTFSFFRETAAAAKRDSMAVYINTTPALGGTEIGSVYRSASLATATVGTESATGWYTYTFYIPSSYFGATNYIIFNGTARNTGNNMYLDKVSIVNPVTTTSLSNSTGGGTWSSSNTAVATIDGSGLVTGIANGTTTISYVTTYGTVTSSFTVNSIPTIASLTASPGLLCSGTTLTLTAGAASGTGGLVSYNWAGPASYFNTTSTPVNTFVPLTSDATGIYSLTVSYNGAGCTSGTVVSSNITVNDAPSSVVGSTSICSGGTASLSCIPSGGTWSSSNPLVATINSVTGAVQSVSVGTTNIQYTQTCGTLTVPFYVILTPDPIGGSNTICGTTAVSILSESWESGVPTAPGSPVDGWSYLTGTGGGSNYWLLGTVAGASYPAITTIPDGTNFANFNSFTVTSGRTAVLASPSFSLSGIGGAFVKFWVYRDATNYPTNYDSLSVFINTSQTLTGARSIGAVCRYYTLTTSTIGAEAAGGWYQYTLNIPASFNGPTNYILFRGTSKYGNDLYLDRVDVMHSPFTTLTETTPGGTWSSTNTGVAQVNSSGTVVAVSAGTADISYSTPCGNVGVTVTVNATPTIASITPSSTSLCLGASITFTAGAATGPGSISSYNWSGPNGYSTTGAAATAVFTPSDVASTGVYSLSVSYPGAGCTSNIVTTPTVTVNDAPTVISGGTTICPGSSSSLSCNVTGGTWSCTDPLVATIDAASGVLYATGLGSATVNYTHTCGNISTPVTVTSTPDPITGVTTLCYTSTSFIPVESWESGVPVVQGTPVDGWNYLKGTGNANNYWLQQGPPGTNPAFTTAVSGTKVARFKSYTISTLGNSATLASPSFSLFGYNGAFVSFSMYRDNGFSTSADSVSVYVNTSMTLTGATRLGNICRSTALATSTAGTVPANGWYQYILNIPSTFTGATNYILFKATSQYGNDIYLDAISVKYAASTVLSENTAGGTWSTTNSSVADVDATGKVIANGLGSAVIAYTTPCGSTSTTITVNNVPTVAGVSPSSSILCLGTQLTLTAGTVTGSGSPTSYNWTGPNSFSTTSAAGSITLSPTTTATSGIYNLSVTYSGVGCITSSVATPSVSVRNIPSVSSITPSSTNYCVGPSLILTAGTVSGTGTLSAYNWSGPSGYSTSGLATIAVLTPTSSAASGIYSLSVSYPGAGCTSGVVTSASVTVNDYPITYTVTGGNGCTSGLLPVGLNNSQSSVSYELRLSPSTHVQTLTGTGSPFSFSSVSTPGSYFVVGTGPGGCQTTMSGTDTVNISPAVTLLGMPSICTGVTSPNVPYNSGTGNPTLYNIAWDAAALSASFGNVSGASLSSPTAGNVTLAVPVAAPEAVYTGTLTVSNGTCVSAGNSLTLTVYAVPTAAITSAVAPCMSDATNIVFTGTPGAIVRYSIDGGAANNNVMAGGTYNLPTGSISVPHTYHLINAHNPACTTAIGLDTTITPIPQKWVGGTVSHLHDWNTNTNWTCGRVPLVTDDVAIDAAYTYAPDIAASSVGSTRNLSIASGVYLTVNSDAVLNVKGNVTNKGSVTGSGKMVLNGSAAQTIDSIGVVNNLELDNIHGAAMHVGSMVTIGSTLTLTSGTLITNDSLVLASSDTMASARIAPIASGAGIANKVIVHQYVQGGYRRYRFMSHPFSTDISLGQLQSSIDITGQGGPANGFTLTGSNAPSAFRYDPYTGNSSLSYDPGWKPFTNISGSADPTNLFHRYQGIRLFMRGAKGEGLGYWFGYTPSDTVIGMTGAVNQGNQTIVLSKGTGSDQDYNMVGNPYPSPVNLGSVIYNASVSGNVSGSAFYVWNPSLGASGQFQAIPITSVTPYYLPANTAYQVRADHDGATLNFTESDKSATATNYLFKAQPDAISLYIYDANYHPWDMLYLKLNNMAGESEDKHLDATKPSGADFNFYSLSSDNKKLAIDSRPYNADMSVPLGISSAYTQDFIIKAESVVTPAGAKIYLHDKLLQKYVLLDQGVEYRFTISKDKATQGDNRFELTMKPAVTVDPKDISVTMTPNPATDDVKVTFTNGQAEPVTIKVMDMSGVNVYGENLGVQQKGTVTVPLNKLASGIYMVELTSGNRKVVQRLIKE